MTITSKFCPCDFKCLLWNLVLLSRQFHTDTTYVSYCGVIKSPQESTGHLINNLWSNWLDIICPLDSTKSYIYPFLKNNHNNLFPCAEKNLLPCSPSFSSPLPSLCLLKPLFPPCFLLVQWQASFYLVPLHLYNDINLHP